MSITPSPRQRAMALRAMHDHAQGRRIVARFWPDSREHRIAAIQHRLGTVYFQPTGTSGWIGAQHLETFYSEPVS